MNCRDMMQIPELTEVLKLKAGENGLEQSVRWIYFADCLQCVKSEYRIENYIHGGEFVVLTNPSVTDDNRKLLELIRQMYGHGITALGINEGQISGELMRYCEEKNLPLFELPEKYQPKPEFVAVYSATADVNLSIRKDKEEIEKDIEWVYELFPRLKERNWQLAGTLSGGEQQMLAVGRGLMSRPKVLMMDEPSLGLAPLVVQGIFDIIREINRQGVTILLIEQNANMALKIADHAYVLETGCITMSGTGAELLANEKVKEAYLGTKRNK